MTTKALMNTYGTKAATLVKGEGVWLWDANGNKYLDALSGIAVCGLGHSHPAIAAAVAEQASVLTHCSNFFAIPNQVALADKLCATSGMDKVFFGNSGAEANEAAIKMARLHGHKKGIKLPTVLVMDNAFHGRTLATLSASGSRKVQAGFEPLVRGFARGSFNDIQSLETIADNNPNICAVFVEPIQGEGGIRVAADDYLKQLREFCTEKGWLLMLDEVQTGNGRTGKYFYYQHSGIVPDVVTTSKGLGNGVPIGACLAQYDDEGIERPVMYLSRDLTKAEKDYHITDKEGLAATWGIRRWRHLLHGAPVVLITDHSALCALTNKRKLLQARQRRYAMDLMEFDLTIVHRAGKLLHLPDMISRLGHKPSVAATMVGFGKAKSLVKAMLSPRTMACSSFKSNASAAFKSIPAENTL